MSVQRTLGPVNVCAATFEWRRRQQPARSLSMCMRCVRLTRSVCDECMSIRICVYRHEPDSTHSLWLYGRRRQQPTTTTVHLHYSLQRTQISLAQRNHIHFLIAGTFELIYFVTHTLFELRNDRTNIGINLQQTIMSGKCPVIGSLT